MRRPVFSVLCTIALVLTLLVTAFAPHDTLAAVDGQNPQSTGCSSGATTAKTYNMYNSSNQVIGTVELRYSSACNAYWTRVNSSIGGTVRGSITRTATGARQTLVSGTTYTYMLAGGSAGNYYVCGTVNQPGTCGM